MHINGDIRGAESGYRKLVASKIPISAAYSNLAYICQSSGRIAEAISLYEQATHIDPTNSLAYYNLGNMLHQKGDVQGAIQQFENAIESKPGYAEAYFNLGYIYKSGQKVHDAIQHFEQAEAFNPELRAFVHKALYELQKDHPENNEIRQKISAISQNNLRNKAIELIKERAEHVTRYQNGVATFEDNHLISIVDNFEKSFSDKIDWDNALEHLPEKDRGNYSEQLRILLLHVKAHDNDRFQALEVRIQTLKETDYPSLHQSYFNFSQGFSSCLKWKDELIFKTAYDLAILNMLIWEIKPRSIIEIGSGNGASAIYMQDLVKMFGLECDILSFDINNKNNTEASVRYLYADCMDISTFEEYARTFENLPHPWLFIEDAHVNVDEVLKYFTGFSRPGDYFYIEDTALKQPEIEKWIKTNGKNLTSAEKQRVQRFRKMEETEDGNGTDTQGGVHAGISGAGSTVV